MLRKIVRFILRLKKQNVACEMTLILLCFSHRHYTNCDRRINFLWLTEFRQLQNFALYKVLLRPIYCIWHCKTFFVWNCFNYRE